MGLVGKLGLVGFRSVNVSGNFVGGAKDHFSNKA
jgi:hypothetical protein